MKNNYELRHLSLIMGVLTIKVKIVNLGFLVKFLSNILSYYELYYIFDVRDPDLVKLTAADRV